MKLKNKYAIGCLVQFYEIEMFRDYIDGIFNIIADIENPENITLDFVYDLREDFEYIDDNVTKDELVDKFQKQLQRIKDTGIKITKQILWSKDLDNPHAIAWYRRDFNYRFADKVDFLMWGETDSFFPKETFEIIEQLSKQLQEQSIYKYVISFAYRKMWDAGWKMIEHPEFTDVPFEDTDEWNLHNPASEKCYMSIQQMNDINDKYTKDGYDILQLREPKFDGSCLVISSDLIKMGINIPHALLMSGEDTSFGLLAQQILGQNYLQFHIKNILRVHNRRHPKKRLYVKNENNPMGFCGEKNKGKWWKILEQMSKENLYNLSNPTYKFHTWQDFFKRIKQTMA